MNDVVFLSKNQLQLFFGFETFGKWLSSLVSVSDSMASEIPSFWGITWPGINNIGFIGFLKNDWQPFCLCNFRIEGVISKLGKCDIWIQHSAKCPWIQHTQITPKVMLPISTLKCPLVGEFLIFSPVYTDKIQNTTKTSTFPSEPRVRIWSQ